MGKDISCQWTRQESRNGNSHIRQNRLKMKAIKKDKEGHYLMVKGSIHGEDVTMIDIYALI